MQNKKLKKEEFRTTVASLFGENFAEMDENRFTLLHEFECTQRIDSPITPAKFQILTDKVSLKKLLRMSWKNTSGVALKNIRMDIVAANSTTEWRIKDAEFDVSTNSDGITAKYGVIIPDAAERCTIEITYVGLADGLYWDKSGEYFGFAVGAQSGIFLTDSEGNRIIETKSKPKVKKKKSAAPLVFAAVSALVLGVGIFAAFGFGLIGGQDVPEVTYPSTGSTQTMSTTRPTTVPTKKTTATTKRTTNTTKPPVVTDFIAVPEGVEEVAVDLDFNAINNGVIKDKSGNGNDAVLTGSATVSGGKITFDRNGAYLTIKNNESINWTAADSFSMTIKFQAAANTLSTTWPCLIQKGSSDNGWWGIWFDNGITNNVVWGGLKTTMTNPPIGIGDTTEHTVTVVQDAEKNKLYVYFDYVKVLDHTAMNYYSELDLWIGGNVGNKVQQFYGSISEFKVVNYVTNTSNSTADEIFANSGYDVSQYTKIDAGDIMHAYYNSTNSNSDLTNPGPSSLVSAENGAQYTNVVNFWATRIFEKSELPNGTVIVLKDGYQYRPEGWQDLNAKNSNARPDNVFDNIVVIDDAWWDNYNYRAFNIAVKGGATTITQSDRFAFAIYVPKEKGEYVDIEFSTFSMEADVFDANGNAYFSYVGTPVVEIVEVTHNGVTREMPALRITQNGNFIVGHFEYLELAEQVDAFLAAGFSLEAFYLDNTVGSSTVSILCTTESGRGFGIAHNRSNQPYFVTGKGTMNLGYNFLYHTSGTSNEELVHVIAVYDPTQKMNLLYVNGELSGTVENDVGVFATPLESVNGTPMCNIFCMGGDLSPSNNYDFPANDLTIVDAKIYNKALNAEEVLAAYEAATADFAVEEPEEPGIYVDVDFADGTVSDSNGKASFQSIGTPVVETVEVTHNGVTRAMEALRVTSSGSFVYGTFDRFDTVEEMNVFLNAGFSVEAFYIDNSTGSSAIVCMTETPDGWGLAHNSGNKPYFITGNGASSSPWNAVYSILSASNTELVHVVATYDPAEKMHTIYVNGVDCSDRTNTSYHGTNVPGVVATDITSGQLGIEAFNTFGLGGEFSAQTNRVGDFLANDLTIVDAKIYNKALNAEEALAAYEAATADFVEPPKSAVEIFTEAGYDLNSYEMLELTPTLHRYYISISSTSIQGDDGDATSIRFWATPVFAKDQIPNGSVIVVSEGYMYRPEGWQTLDSANSGKRPDNVNTSIIVVDDAWWGDYNYRAFNVAKEDLSEMTESEYGVFAIYVPMTTEEVPTEKGEYVDIDFADGTVSDSNGNASFQMIGTPVVETVEVTHNGVTRDMAALRITSSGSFVVGTFDKLDSQEKMNAMLAEGFSIEAFYLDNSSYAAAIFCNTESNKGYGIAHQKNTNASQNNKPYFVTGSGVGYNTAYLSTAASDTELVHVVAVYDAAMATHHIYINGQLSGSTSNVTGVITTDMESKEGIPMFNTFGLGGDLSPTRAGDFLATDLTIVDAKFYRGALTAEEALAAYEAVAAEFTQ